MANQGLCQAMSERERMVQGCALVCGSLGGSSLFWREAALDLKQWSSMHRITFRENLALLCNAALFTLGIVESTYIFRDSLRTFVSILTPV